MFRDQDIVSLTGTKRLTWEHLSREKGLRGPIPQRPVHRWSFFTQIPLTRFSDNFVLLLDLNRSKSENGKGRGVPIRQKVPSSI